MVNAKKIISRLAPTETQRGPAPTTTKHHRSWSLSPLIPCLKFSTDLAGSWLWLWNRPSIKVFHEFLERRAFSSSGASTRGIASPHRPQVSICDNISHWPTPHLPTQQASCSFRSQQLSEFTFRSHKIIIFSYLYIQLLRHHYAAL